MANKKHFVITAIGKDRPGIVSAVTEVLYLNRCNIEDSSMTILGGEFAVIMIVSAPAKLTQNSLEHHFVKAAKRLSLNIQCKDVKLPPKYHSSETEKQNPHMISLLGADQPGLVYRVARLLADQKINITDVNTKVVGSGKKPVYAMLIEVELPKKLSPEKIKNELTKLGKKLKADITLKPVDVFQL